MIILEILQWGVLLYGTLMLYQCYKVIKSLIEVKKKMTTMTEEEFRKVYKHLNELSDKIEDFKKQG